MGRVEGIAVALKLSSRLGNLSVRAMIQTGSRIVVPIYAICFGQLPVHTVANSNFKRLQRPVKRRADGCIPGIEPCRRLTISTSRSQISGEAIQRSRLRSASLAPRRTVANVKRDAAAVMEAADD